MKKQINYLLNALLLITSLNLFAADPKYAVSDIPENLLNHAKAVVRHADCSFELLAIDRAVQHESYAITILNDNGMDLAYLKLFFIDLQRISNVKVKVYDEKGELVKRVKAKDVRQRSAVPSYTLYNGIRLQYVYPEYQTLPMTIEFSYDIIYNGLLYYPSWTPYYQGEYNISVEKASFTFQDPNKLNLRFKEKNIAGFPGIKRLENGENITYMAHNLPALTNEDYSPGIFASVPVVYFAPLKFKMEEYQGSMQSWKQFGEWNTVLNKTENNLSPKTIRDIHNIRTTVRDKRERVRKVYDYFQDKTRYIYAHEGLGGWKCHDVSIIEENGYGDCKDLSNYLKTLLEKAGLNAYVALVKAGSFLSDFEEDFPSNQFNHVIVMVPMEKDTIWLEATNQQIPYDYLGSFTDDRPALLIKGEESCLIRTPAMSSEDNLCKRWSNVQLAADGGGSAKLRTAYKGLHYDREREKLNLDIREQKKQLENEIRLADLKINNFSIKQTADTVARIDEEVDLDFRNFGSLLGNRIIFPLNFNSGLEYVPPKYKERKSEVFVQRPVSYCDTIVYELPVGASLEALPEEVNIECTYGKYASSVQLGERGEIIFSRHFVLNKGRYPASEYSAFREFFAEVQKADYRKAVIAL